MNFTVGRVPWSVGWKSLWFSERTFCKLLFSSIDIINMTWNTKLAYHGCSIYISLFMMLCLLHPSLFHVKSVQLYAKKRFYFLFPFFSVMVGWPCWEFVNLFFNLWIESCFLSTSRFHQSMIYAAFISILLCIRFHLNILKCYPNAVTEINSTVFVQTEQPPPDGSDLEISMH